MPDIDEPRRLVPRFPEGAAPEAAAPEADTPEAGVPETGVPEAGVPEAGVPEAAAPEAAAGPEAAAPEAGTFAFPDPLPLDLSALDSETALRSIVLVAGAVAVAAGIVALAVWYSRRRGLIPTAGAPLGRGSANTVSLTPRRSGGNQAGRLPRFWVELGYRSRQAFRDAWHAGKFPDRTIEGVLKAAASP